MSAVVHSLATVLAASGPSKVPFYVAGALLAAWAVVLAAIGLSNADFPGSPGRARAVMAISAVLVLATVSSAVATSSKHAGEHAKGEQNAQARPPQGQTPAPAGQSTTKAPAPQGGGSATVKIAADPTGQLKFQQTSVTAKPGRVTIEFDNPSPVQHDVTVTAGKGKLGGTKVVANGKATAALSLQPGSYTFYCSVDSHRQAGMEGKLTVG